MGAVFLVQERVPLASWLVGGSLLAIALAVLTLPWWAGRLGERFPEQRLRLAGLVTVAAWLVLGLAAAIVGRL
jgi:MFS family permease